MKYANTVEEYINLYTLNFSVTEISVSEEIKEELISYLEEKKDTSDDILILYALLLSKGIYIDQNIDLAVSIFKTLAEQGNARAQCSLGYCYSKGKGVSQDNKQAVYWYEKSAKQGNAIGQYNLGVCYKNGRGEEQSYEQAVYWYKKATAQGYAKAQNNLGICYKNGQGVTQSYEQAVYWYKKAAEQGNAGAQCNLGICYKNSHGVSQDYKQAFQWFQKSAEQGNTTAQFNLGYCYEKGQGVEKDYATAIYWYEKSAKHGNARAQCFLGYCYEKGQGVTQSYEQAVYWYEKSAEQGYSYSQFSLAFLYENGLGCEKNIDQALNWYQKAADHGNEDAKEALERVSKLIEDIKYRKEKLHYCSQKDVFVSWNHKDKEIKDELFNRLEEKNILTVWESDGDGNGDLSDCIKNAITAAHSYVIILTGNSVQSRWVEKEVKEILNKAGDYEKIYKNLSHEDNAYKQTIRVILLNTITINDKKEYFDVEGYIKENLGEQSVFHKLLTLAWIFPVNNEIDYDKLELSLTKAIEWSYLLEYKKNIKGKYGVFTAVLTKVVENNDVKSGIISTALDFEKSYLNREVFDKNEQPYSVEALLKLSNPVLIYGEGGTGKSLFLQNVLRKYFDKNRYLFYLTSAAITKTINELNLDIIHILKEKCFNYAFTEEEQKKVSFEGFEQLFFENEIILLIDALDELDTESKTVFFEKLEKFYDTYNKEKKLHIIFTSRTKTDRILIEKCLKKELSLFELRGITKNDIESLYESMIEKYTPSKNEFSFYPDKQIFMNHLEKIQDDIKNNPLLISNLIFIYLTTKKILDKKFDIIDTTVSIMVKDIEQERSIEFKYLDYIQKNLYEFLGYIALNESNGNTESLETLTNDFFTEEVEKNQDDIEVVSAEICKFLKRRAIIVENHISHSIFSYFLVARYIFEEIYKSAKTSTMKKYLTFKDEKLLDDYIKEGFKKQEESWANISSDFLMKIDNEIYSFSKDAINENHHSYDTFHITLTKTLKEKGFSETAIKVIEEMVKHNMFYFNDFIKKYI